MPEPEPVIAAVLFMKIVVPESISLGDGSSWRGMVDLADSAIDPGAATTLRFGGTL